MRLTPDGRGAQRGALGGQMAAPTGPRRSIRLSAYDYTTPGAYFVTVCVQDHQPIFSDRNLRDIATEAWSWLPQRFPSVGLDEFIIMPDHVHFIIRLLDDADRRGGRRAAPGAQQRAPTLGNVVGAFKTVCARSVNILLGTRGQRVWQRNYFERIVRNEDELHRVREYIRNNPLSEHAHTLDDLEEAWAAQAGS